uniref:Uncharacterized protein n=1 Tax=Anguilla anguilla TaxID=7936 RepID=A0A0E9UWC4_ANGAN
MEDYYSSCPAIHSFVHSFTSRGERGALLYGLSSTRGMVHSSKSIDSLTSS